MGLVQGKVDANRLIVMDSFALPVEGTETRVNAQAQAYEYMTTYTENCEPVGRKDKVGRQSSIREGQGDYRQ
jgi:COP9 signalosome complex subunit 5